MVDSELMKIMQRRRGGAPPASGSNSNDNPDSGSTPAAASAPASAKPATTAPKPPVPPKTSNVAPSSTTTPDLDDPSLPPWKREMLRKKMAATSTAPANTQPSPKPPPPKPFSPKPAPSKPTTSASPPASPKPASPKPTTPASPSKPTSSSNEDNDDDDSSLPPWKREIMRKKRTATTKDSSESTIAADDPSLPPWKREMLRKKRASAAAPPVSPGGGKSAAATLQSPVQQSPAHNKSPSVIKSPVSAAGKPPSSSENNSSTPKAPNAVAGDTSLSKNGPPAPPIAGANDGQDQEEEEETSIPPWKRELQQRRASGNTAKGLLSPKPPPPPEDDNDEHLPPWKRELQARKTPLSPSSTRVDSSEPPTTTNDDKENNTMQIASPIKQTHSSAFDDDPTMLDEDPTMLDEDPTMMPPKPPVHSQSVPQPSNEDEDEDEDGLSKNSNLPPELQAIMKRRRKMKDDDKAKVAKEMDDQQLKKDKFGLPPELAEVMQKRQQIAESKKGEEEVIEEDEEEVIEEDEEEVIEEGEELEEELEPEEEMHEEDVHDDKEDIQEEENHDDEEAHAEGAMEDHEKDEEAAGADDIVEKNEKTMDNVAENQLQNADSLQVIEADKGGGVGQRSTAAVGYHETEMLDASEFSNHYFGERSKLVDDQGVDPMGVTSSVGQQRDTPRQGGYPLRRKSLATTMSPYDYADASKNVGLERAKADKRQLGGLLLVFSLCVACQPLGLIVGLIGPDGTTASEGVEYVMLIAGLVQVFLGSAGVFVGYLSLVQDHGSHYLTRLLIFLTLLGYLPLATEIVDIWRGASELPKKNPFIPVEYKPSSTDIQFVGALGIVGIIAYTSSLFGSMFFSASALYVIQNGKHSTLSRSYYRGKLLVYSCLLVLAGVSQALIGIQVMDVAGSGPLEDGPVSVGRIYYVNFPELSIGVGIVQFVAGLFGMARYLGSLNRGEDDHRFQIFIGAQAVCMLAGQVITQISYTGRSTDEEFAPSIAALSIGLNLFPAYLDYKMRTAPVDPSRDLFYSPPLEPAEKEDTVLEEGSEHSRPNPGLERLKADRRQIGGLMLCLAICVVLQPLSSIAALIGPDGTTASRGVAYARLLSGVVQVVFGMMGVFVGYLCLVQDQGNKHLTRLLIAIIQLAYIPFFTWIIDVGQQANADPKDNPLIPAKYEPVLEDIHFIGAMGIFGVIAYSISFFGALAFTAFALYAFHVGKPETRSGLYYRSRLLFYTTLLVFAGLSQILVGGQVLGVVGTGPLEDDPITVAMYYVNFPELSIIVGAIQLFSGCFGMVRYARYKECAEDDHRFQVAMGVQAFLMLALQIIVQISYTKRDVDEALAPSIAYLSVGLSLVPAFLDFKMRTAPLEYPDDHYGRYHYIEYDYGGL